MAVEVMETNTRFGSIASLWPSPGRFRLLRSTDILRIRRHVSGVPSGDIARLERSSAGPPGRRAAAWTFASARGLRRALAYYNNSFSKSNSCTMSACG